MRRLALILALACLIAPAHARDVDKGGYILDYAHRVRDARGTHRISGDCMSACTLWLGYPGSCVTRDAVLWFHGATSEENAAAGIYEQDIVEPEGNAFMLDYYPPRVRDIVRPWLDHVTQFHALTAAELVALGVPACK